MPWDIALCSWQDNWLSQCLFPPRCINGYRQYLMLGVILRRTSISSRGSGNISSRLKLRPNGGHLGSYADFTFTYLEHLLYVLRFRFTLFQLILQLFLVVWDNVYDICHTYKRNDRWQTDHHLSGDCRATIAQLSGDRPPTAVQYADERLSTVRPVSRQCIFFFFGGGGGGYFSW